MSGIPDQARALCRRTPLLFSPPLGCWLKLESLQVTGSFKPRGASVKLARLSPSARARGVIASSAGNHGLGVALAARALGVRAKVFVPRTAAEVKRRGIADLGAEVVLHGERYVEAEQRARQQAEAEGAVFVSPFDDEDIIEGSSWLGAELLEQQATLERVLVPVGGGGLIAGVARALAPRSIEVVGVQPRLNCAMYESFRLGQAQTAYVGGVTQCEALEGACAESTFEIARSHGCKVVLVDEDEVLAAMAFAYRTLGLIVEASAAVVLAAARAGRVAGGAATALVVTGSNVDPAALDHALAASALCS